MNGFRDQNPANGVSPAQDLAQDLAAQDLAVDDCGCPPAPIPEGALVREMSIVNRKGLHARATAKFVQCAETFDAAVQVTRCGETVGGTSIMGILTLGAGIGTTITVTATGEQAQQALDALGALVANRFGEDE